MSSLWQTGTSREQVAELVDFPPFSRGGLGLLFTSFRRLVTALSSGRLSVRECSTSASQGDQILPLHHYKTITKSSEKGSARTGNKAQNRRSKSLSVHAVSQ